MRSLFLVALVMSTSVFAQDIVVDGGVVLVPAATFLKNEKACAAAEAERNSLKASVKEGPSGVPVWLTVVIGVVAAGAGLGVGLGVARKTP